MKDLDERLGAISQKRNEKQLIEAHLLGIREKLRNCQSEHVALGHELDELDDLLQEEDSQTSVSKLFKKILGDKTQEKERERQAYLMTYLKFKDLEQRIQAKEYEISVLKTKLASFSGVDTLYKKLLTEKKQQLKFRHKDLATEIILLETAIRQQVFQQSQIQQAGEIGSELIQLLTELYDGLVEISTVDHLYATEMRNNTVGFQISIHKRKQAKTLNQTLQIISRKCDSFTDELNDVTYRFDLDYNPFIPQITQFLENFYDGFISDWIRRKGLKISLNQIDTTLAKVHRILSMLEKDIAHSRTTHSDLKAKLEKLVLENKM